MKIIFDPPKRLRNIQKHGLFFEELTIDFFRGAAVTASSEGRFVAVGELAGRGVVAVVFKPLGSEAISVISMRPASKKERQLR